LTKHFIITFRKTPLIDLTNKACEKNKLMIGVDKLFDGLF